MGRNPWVLAPNKGLNKGLDSEVLVVKTLRFCIFPSAWIVIGVSCLVPAGAALGAEIRIHADERLAEATPGCYERALRWR